MKNLLFLKFLLLFSLFSSGQVYELRSPNLKNKISISVREDIKYSVTNDNTELISPSCINMKLKDDIILGENPVIINVIERSENNILKPVIKVKSEKIEEVYNEMRIDFKNNFSLTFRAYNEGIAYRFETSFIGQLTVLDEKVQVNIDSTSYVYFPREKSFLSMNEVPYLYQQVGKMRENELGSLPLLFEHSSNTFLLFTESDLDDYPGLWFKVDTSKNFVGTFPAIPTKLRNTGSCWDGLYVEERAEHIAETKGTRTFPWRLILIADQEKYLITNQLVYLLAKPAEKGDYSWIKPGMATLDWWGRWNLFGVDFKGGVNMETFKYFIDFNSKFGIPYFVMDDGWSDVCDIYKTNENLNLKEIIDYANKKNVGILLWIQTHVLKKDVKGILNYFSELGIKGIKVDFFNRDDQEMINLFHEIAQEAMERKLIIDFHGSCKPFGLIRSYPNVLTSEGLIEFEQNGVSDNANPNLHTLLPFVRMVAGPMDYLPGTVNNAQKTEFYNNGDRPVGLGTRAHSMALSVIFESPITMLPDSPSDYYNEEESIKFLSGIPVVWDETMVIDAKLGEYVVIARRNGKEWLIAAITNWEQRELSIKLDFLDDNSKYDAEIFKDGPNSNSRATDYKKEYAIHQKGDMIKINMAQGGGWVSKVSPQKLP